jgi:hypothetical protein
VQPWRLVELPARRRFRPRRGSHLLQQDLFFFRLMGQASKPYVLLRYAFVKSSQSAVAKVALRSREVLVLILPKDAALNELLEIRGCPLHLVLVEVQCRFDLLYDACGLPAEPYIHPGLRGPP